MANAAFSIAPQGAFSLAQSKGFLKGFTPASGNADLDAAADNDFAIVFLLDKTFQAAAVSLSQAPDGVVHGRVHGGADVAAAKKQVARMLALNEDGRGWDDVGKRDAAVGAVQGKFPGFRPVSFASPYEAGVWAMLTQRISMTQAASIRKKIAMSLGESVDVDGRTMFAFPSPQKVIATERADGVPDEKWERIRVLAAAAVGDNALLDADALRAMDRDDALAKLETLRGVGAWSAAHILLRGTGMKDDIALEEPRVVKAIAFAYGKTTLAHDDVVMLAESWKPFRTWAMVLLVLHLGRYGDWSVARGARGRRTSKKAPATKKKASAKKKR